MPYKKVPRAPAPSGNALPLRSKGQPSTRRYSGGPRISRIEWEGQAGLPVARLLPEPPSIATGAFAVVALGLHIEFYPGANACGRSRFSSLPLLWLCLLVQASAFGFLHGSNDARPRHDFARAAPTLSPRE